MVQVVGLPRQERQSFIVFKIDIINHSVIESVLDCAIDLVTEVGAEF